MAFKHKFTYEEKVKIVSEYIDGTYGFREICKRYDINQGSLKDWKRLYETFGWSGLKTGSKTTRYSKETKEAAVRDYLSHEFTFPEILKKYQIRSGTQLKKWIKKYNGCEVLKSSGTGGNNIMTTGRKPHLMKGSKSYSIVLHMIIIMPKQPKNIRYPISRHVTILLNMNQKV